MMTWLGWFIIALSLVGFIVRTVNVGKPREPITPKDLAFGFVITVTFIVGYLTLGTGTGVI